MVRVGKGAGQTVPHVHFHIIQRPGEEKGSEMTDAERKSIALGEGQDNS
jgi:diadenosine tetraphosphate (Ap4A) HIT family hydrolase